MPNLYDHDCIVDRYKNSLYFLKRRPEERDDIERFSDKYRK